MRRRPNVGLLSGHRLRRWPNNKPTLGRRLIFAGVVVEQVQITNTAGARRSGV